MQIKSSIKSGQRGRWKIERFRVSKADAKSFNLRADIIAIQGRTYRPIKPGMYTRALRDGHVVMSDTPAEVNDLYEFAYQIHGRVLITGLGLGIAAEIALKSPDVEHVIVIEIDEDIIALVGTQLKKRYPDKLTIIHADALEWKPPRGAKYGTVWHDIWDGVCTANIPQIHLLKRRYARRSDWVGVWASHEHFRLKRIGW